jgi:DNA-binding NtrC family response regulator
MMKNSILVVDDEKDFLESVRRGLVSSGFSHVRIESDPLKAKALLEQGEAIDIALIDINMPHLSGIALLEFIMNQSPETQCIMVSALNEARVAVECLKKGAYDYLVKPVSRDDLLSSVKRAIERKKLFELLELTKNETVPELRNKEAFDSIVTKSSRMSKLLREAELHAMSDVPVLITGESGTGKELLAKSIHLASPRAKCPFTALNMVSIPGNLFDAEFFGYVKGAFTGAEKDRIGYVEYTHHGTLFLDEIGDLPFEFQGKLLRVLQDGEYMRLGTNKSQKTDIRCIAATNKDLNQMVSRGTFRKDLYYRLKGAWLHLPPLRERKEDIPLLINLVLKEFSPQSKVELDEEAISSLMTYDFPGNIRELRSILQGALNLAQGGPITSRCLPDYLPAKPSIKKDAAGTDGPILPLEAVEKNHILRAYDATGRNKSQTAKLLGLGLNTLRRKLESYGVE